MNFTSPYTKFKDPVRGATFEVFLTNPTNNELAAVGAVVANYVAHPASWNLEGECKVNGLRNEAYDLMSIAPSERFRNLPTDAKVWVQYKEPSSMVIPRHFCQILDEESILVYPEGRTSHSSVSQPPVCVPADSVYAENDYPGEKL